MASPFNMPDEFVQGFFKSAQTLMQAFTGLPGDASASAAKPPSLALAQAQAHYWQQQMALYMGIAASATGKSPEPTVSPERGDRRFNADVWRDNPWYSLLKQTYLLNARLLDEMVEAAGIEEKEKHKLRFYVRQFIDSMSPANFAATNPEVMTAALESLGESIRAGFANLVDDLKRGRISITDESAFEVGRNVAVSKGSVVFENELFQLIQYAPLTEEVATRPLVIVPPCINKFYILDLQPENSFVRFASEQSQTVFLVSWRNPGAELAHITWDDYLEKGAMKAIEVGLAISGADKVNAVGWCVGGTILSSAVAVLRTRGDESVASITLLTTMLDFSDPGDLGVFIDEQGVSQREQSIGRGGIYPGLELGFVFQTLRANDLIWPYVVNRYLKGGAPQAFDLLYWNADGTNLPGPMYAWYLRNMYLENNLCKPARLTMCGTPVDLGCIDMPSYVLATLEDHIVPWKGAYRTTQLVGGGKTQFVLGASGHIAGVINPASKNKRSFWTDGKLGDEPEAWLSSAKSKQGSWWTHWMDWLKPHAGKSGPAPRRLGNAKYKPIEPAPGRYVRKTSEGQV
ncbi:MULTISPECIES: PHA/PHB synthase family protein [Paraburkholderia]|uniref:Poly(3-hydroxyalkanoate) polymerase subunit PhaC n=1 Tax=Paraburkholderia nemoris TaxID=2793076 RepID=A0ABN7N702_9BURK|nr:MULTISPECIES: class I poly(R)-hydroxyalkanoic acid synthase [Paraburkholderia]MBK5153272.1 class I poly(R)-hydroxyalkanoic acid synthase [Burkholderia sp. R-69608]MBK5185757.1 class I poly(R)-hydroxyalkanoic acid synthase [Burkholderia sp. R-69749]MBK3744593.1 class I poly(R)-hydroxyalkanoic acid synthase [Paraburkholderia aspalathi]MBK3816261.1 class I poly(R)-hydroxyalkanoic acid synthase [Paraburkholderia aspalathi]CAE6844277.1 Poly(3-hydroxyalkanoate) polymerase subunit PhaC [Paraburkho